MKERIYTIPVTEAFGTDCECPLCVLERKLEDESVDYMLGPSLMEPDGRIETNEKGFCRHHFQQLYNRRSHRHGLSLILDTHLSQHREAFEQLFHQHREGIRKEGEMSLLKNVSARISSKSSANDKFLDQMLKNMKDYENKCTICARLDRTMERYTDVLFYLWSKEEDFRTLFQSKKGFCLLHLRQLLEGARKYLGPREAAQFVVSVMDMELEQLKRVNEEINWFTKKFDYRYNDEPWGNSKDAVPRTIQKLVGPCDLGS